MVLLISLAQQTVHGVNQMDNLILARRVARSNNQSVPFMSDIKDERANYDRFTDYLGGRVSDDNVQLKESLVQVRLGPEKDKAIKPSASARELRSSIKKEPQSSSTSKSYAKPTGAMYKKNILPDFESRFDKFNRDYIPDTTISLDQVIDVYGRSSQAYFEKLLTGYCKNSSDVTPLRLMLNNVFIDLQDDYISFLQGKSSDDDQDD